MATALNAAAIALLLVAAACGDEGDEDVTKTDPGMGDASVEADSEPAQTASDASAMADVSKVPEARPDGSTSNPSFAGPGLTGVLHDHHDKPLAFEMILACMPTVCLSGDTDENGRFFFDIEPPAQLALKVLDEISSTSRRGAVLYPVQIKDRALVDLNILRAPSLPEGVPLALSVKQPATLVAGDGLQLTIVTADLQPRLGDSLSDVAARLIPPAGWPKIELESEELVAVYALHPFGAKSRTPIGVQAPTTLADGTAVKFRTVSDLDGHLSSPVSGAASGGFMTTAAGAGIGELTWLIIS